jgi:uronate dehydrogenase
MDTVLLTGAAGAIGTTLRASLPDLGWSIRCIDRRAGDGIIVGDVTSPADLDAVVAGTTAIVHFAGYPSEAPWTVLREVNIEATFQVFEAARRHGVRRIVYASSNHAVGFTPLAEEIEPDLTPRPDTLYGVSKIYGEALARYYVDRYGLQVACVRIGSFGERPPHFRALSTWLSPGDCARVVDACLRADNLDYAVIWGVSANTRRTWSLAAGHALGYFPVDDAEVFAATFADGEQRAPETFVGGALTTNEYGIDEILAAW